MNNETPSPSFIGLQMTTAWYCC